MQREKEIVYTYTHSYGTTQRQLDARTRSAGSAPEGNIRGTRYGCAGTCWDFSCVEQGSLVTSASTLKIPECTIMIRVPKDTYARTCLYLRSQILLLDSHFTPGCSL